MRKPLRTKHESCFLECRDRLIRPCRLISTSSIQTSGPLARRVLGFSRLEARFPTKGPCLSIYSRTVNEEAPLDQVLMRSFPWCAGWQAELTALFRAYVEAKQGQNVLDYDDLLLYLA